MFMVVTVISIIFEKIRRWVQDSGCDGEIA